MATDYGRMGQGAQQYGEMGYQMGGAYGAIAGAIIGAVLGKTQGDKVQKAFDKYNDQVVKNAAIELFDMQRVQNAQKRQMSAALHEYSMQQELAQGSYNAAFGAADMIGGSADALAQTLDYQTKQAQAELWFNFDTSVDNYNRSIHSMVNEASARLKRSEEASHAMDYSQLAQQGAAWYSNYKGKSQGASGLSGLWDTGSGSMGGSAGGGGMMGGGASSGGAMSA